MAHNCAGRLDGSPITPTSAAYFGLTRPSRECSTLLALGRRTIVWRAKQLGALLWRPAKCRPFAPSPAAAGITSLSAGWRLFSSGSGSNAINLTGRLFGNSDGEYLSII